MTYLDISNMVYSMGLPYAFDHFQEGEKNPEGTTIAPPFIIYFWEDRDFRADNINYVGRCRLFIELYTENKDITLEKQVERILTLNGLSYRKDSAYLEYEKLWESEYQMEVIIDG